VPGRPACFEPAARTRIWVHLRLIASSENIHDSRAMNGERAAIPEKKRSQSLVNSPRLDKAGRGSGPLAHVSFWTSSGKLTAASHGANGIRKGPRRRASRLCRARQTQDWPLLKSSGGRRSPTPKLCVAQEPIVGTLKTSNPVLFRKPFLIIWKPRPPNLIPQVCSGFGRPVNLFVNSVLARIADCRPTGGMTLTIGF